METFEKEKKVVQSSQDDIVDDMLSSSEKDVVENMNRKLYIDVNVEMIVSGCESDTDDVIALVELGAMRASSNDDDNDAAAATAIRPYSIYRDSVGALSDGRYNLLHKAAEAGNLRLVQFFVEMGCDLTEEFGLRRDTPLLAAAFFGQTHVVKYLVGKTDQLLSNVNSMGQSILFSTSYAILDFVLSRIPQCTSPADFQKFIDIVDVNGNSALMHALMLGKTRNAERLLRARQAIVGSSPDIHWRELFYRSVVELFPMCSIEFITERALSEGHICFNAPSDDIDTATDDSYLLMTQIVDLLYRKPIFRQPVVTYDFAGMLAYFFKKGCNVNTYVKIPRSSSNIYSSNNRGGAIDPLLLAVCHFKDIHIRCLNVLLESGADTSVRSKKDGSNCLLIALKGNEQEPRWAHEKVKILLEYGADSFDENDAGESAYKYIKEMNNPADLSHYRRTAYFKNPISLAIIHLFESVSGGKAVKAATS